MSEYVMDLRRSRWSRSMRGFRVFGTWIPKSDNPRESEPCLAILPENRRATPAIVALSVAYKYTDPVEAAISSSNIAKHFGMDDLSSAMAIGEVINYHLSDLISMPPEPKDTVVVGHAKVGGLGDKPQTLELLDHVPVNV